MSRIYRLTHPLRPDTSTCILSNRDDLVDLACYVLVKARPAHDFESLVFGEQLLALLQTLLQSMGKPIDLNHLVSALHHFETLALTYCNQLYLDKSLALHKNQAIGQWNPTLLEALQSSHKTPSAHQDPVLQKLAALIQTTNRTFFEIKTAGLPLLMLVLSNHQHLSKVLEAMKAAQPVADPGDDASVVEVDLQQALEARKAWWLSIAQEHLNHQSPEYDTLLLNEPVTTLMDEEHWAAEWLQPADSACNSHVISWRRLQNCLFQGIFYPSVKHG